MLNRLLTLVLSTLIVLVPVKAQAQLLTLGVSNTTTGGGGAYVGPEDAAGVSATYCYSLRACSAADAAGLVNAIQLCTALDAACANIPVTATGGLNTGTLTSLGCNVVLTCTIKTWYNQDTGNDATQTTIANRATFNPSCIGSLPCAVSAGSPVDYAIASITTPQPFTVNAASNRTGNTSSYGVLISQGNSNFYFGYKNATNTMVGAANAEGTKTASDNAMHGLTMVANGASGVLSVDGAQTTTNLGSVGGPSSGDLFSLAATSPFTGNAFEILIFPSALSSGAITALNTNQHTYGLF